MIIYQLMVPIGLALFGVGLWSAPSTAMAERECSIPTIVNAEDLVSHSLACNGTQQAIDARWQAQQLRAEVSGYLDDPKLTVGVAPQTLGDERFDDGYIIELSQPLPWPGVLSLRKNAAGAQVGALEAMRLQGQVNLAKQVRLAYAQWQYHQQLLTINHHHQALWQEFRTVVRAKYAAGTAGKSEVLHATQGYHLLLQETIELKARIDRDLSEMKRLGNLDQHTRIELDTQLPLTEFAVEQWQLSTARLDQQPRLQMLNAQQQQKSYELSLAEKDRYPSFNVLARYNSLWMNDEQRWVVGVGVNLPLTFGKRSRLEDSLRAEQQALRWEQQDLQAQLREVLTQTHSQWQQAKDVYALYQQDLLPLAEETLTTAQDEYQSGSGDFLSLLTAQRQLLSTQRAAEQALRDQYMQFSQLLAASGVVFKTDLYDNASEGTSNE
ncbi:TolC family protein [Ketobacter sp.]|nr:MAG: TolC family protein [Ketobacter sp.]